MSICVSDDLVGFQQANLKKFLQRMLLGFEELMAKVDHTIPMMTNKLNERAHEIEKIIEEQPVVMA